ncbi:MAG: acyl-CoA dehydrogenase family protein [Eubacterium sp.]|nr:acyl-CoA dehydrogenase family protein [Eubacterium sp.]
MAYRISEYGEEVCGDIGAHCRRELAEALKEGDRSGIWPAEAYEKASAIGLGALALDEEYGGLGLTRAERAACLETLAWTDAGLAVSYLGNSLAQAALEASGTEEQKQQYLQAMADGDFGAFCLTESDAGSDLSRCRTRAARQEDGSFLLNGAKVFVTNGPIASFYVVFAVTGDSMSAFLVDRETPGVSIGPEESKLGIRNSRTSEVVFEDVRLTEAQLLGMEGDGLVIAEKALTQGRIWCGVCAVGIAQRALDEAADYAKEREQFGRPIAENPVICAKLAEMEIRTWSARQCCAAALDAEADGENVRKAASIAKCAGSDAAVFCASEAVQIFGGNGYCADYPVEKLLRDAKVFQIFEGTNEIQRMIIGKEVVKGR